MGVEFNPMFSTMSAIKSVFTQLIMTLNVLTVTDENDEQCIFPILPVSVLWSYQVFEIFNHIWKIRDSDHLKFLCTFINHKTIRV